VFCRNNGLHCGITVHYSLDSCGEISSPPLITLILVEIILWLAFPQGTYPPIDTRMTQDIPGLSKEVHFTKNKLGLRANSIDAALYREANCRTLFAMPL